MVLYNPYNYGAVTGIQAAAGMAPYGLRYFRGSGNTKTARQFRSKGATQTMVTSRRSTKTKSHSFRSKLVANIPAKHYAGNITSTMVHNTIYMFSPPQSIALGDAYNQRDGDFVDLIALKLKGIFQTPTTSNAYSYRIIVGYSGEEYTSNAGALTAAFTDAELFLPNTSGNWVINGIINPKAFTSIYDQTLDINSLEPSTQEINSFAVSVPLNKKYPYQANASIFGKDRNLYVICLASVVGGVAGVTDCGAVVLGYDLIYKSV